MVLLFETRDEGADPYAIAKQSTARTDVRYGRKLHWNCGDKSHLAFLILTLEEETTPQKEIAAYMQQEMNEDMFGESNHRPNQKRRVLKRYL